jgi:hypothetical protein
VVNPNPVKILTIPLTSVNTPNAVTMPGFSTVDVGGGTGTYSAIGKLLSKTTRMTSPERASCAIYAINRL